MRLPAILTVLLALTPPALPAGENAAPMMVTPDAPRPAGMPARGATMDQVKQEFGAPLRIIAPSGEVTKTHPPITRWVYKDYIVYFENDRVIHSARPRSLEIIKFLEASPLPQAVQPASKAN